jgi:hypothetical protein
MAKTRPYFARSATAAKAAADLEERIEVLEEKVDILSRENASLQISNASLTSRLNASLILFESRVDSVYRAIVDRSLREEGIAIDRPSEEEIEHQLRALVLGGLSTDTAVADLKLNAMLDGEMKPGVFSGPLTLYGFRLKRKHAREMGDGIAVKPGSAGIVMFGPYKRLNPGNYTFGFELQIDQLGQAGEIEVDIYCASIDEVVAKKILHVDREAGVEKLELNVNWTAIMSRGTVEVRLHQRCESAFTIKSFLLQRN